MADAPVVVVPPVNVDELAVGTKVLSLWGKALYTATIIRIRGEAPNRKFKIRYEVTRPANVRNTNDCLSGIFSQARRHG